MADKNLSTTGQQQELYKHIWSIAQSLRGAVDGWEFKAYVLNTMFYRFISEQIVTYIDDIYRDQVGEGFVSYVDLDDETAENGREEIVDQLGYFILPSQLFTNVMKNSSEDDLNVILADVFKSIEESDMGTDHAGKFSGMFDDMDVNSNKLGPNVQERNRKLSQVLNAIGGIDFGTAVTETNIDPIGICYESLLKFYCSSAGKSGGEFYTPQPVSTLLARLAMVHPSKSKTVYDPTCGSGGLLLRFAKENGTEPYEHFYGQELNITTYNLARMNMFLHGIPYEKFDIRQGDTLTNPRHHDINAAYVVANPPYSVDWVGDDDPAMKDDPRFSGPGVLAPKKKKADLAFTLHMLHSLADDGTAAIVEFPGVMYREKAEQKIRKWFIDNNYVDAVIQLPEDMFYGTNIATCILVLRKGKTEDDVVFIDASDLYYRDGTKNVMTEEHINTVVDLYRDRQDVENRCKLVDNDEIAEQKWNLSVSTYVEIAKEEEKVDIDAINEELDKLVERENELRAKIAQFISSMSDDEENGEGE